MRHTDIISDKSLKYRVLLNWSISNLEPLRSYRWFESKLINSEDKSAEWRRPVIYGHVEKKKKKTELQKEFLYISMFEKL